MLHATDADQGLGGSPNSTATVGKEGGDLDEGEEKELTMVREEGRVGCAADEEGRRPRGSAGGDEEGKGDNGGGCGIWSPSRDALGAWGRVWERNGSWIYWTGPRPVMDQLRILAGG